ncbi:hypothetical protein [Rhodococcus sp. p52]|uniref:hypothetical protein n=1 Tax=Rhodococcus sp. p52 TaxID=935199 RepID=UPI000A911F66|nr:hypothetical protein [Rhodococcus sp. p52]
MVPRRRLPSPEHPAPALTRSDLEAVLESLTGRTPTEADLAAVWGCLFGTAPPGDKSS